MRSRGKDSRMPLSRYPPSSAHTVSLSIGESSSIKSRKGKNSNCTPKMRSRIPMVFLWEIKARSTA